MLSSEHCCWGMLDLQTSSTMCRTLPDIFIAGESCYTAVGKELVQIMESTPESPIDVLRKAINSLRPDRPHLAEAFEDRDLQKLLAEGFKSVDDLKDADRNSLLALGLPRARVANLKPGLP